MGTQKAPVRLTYQGIKVLKVFLEAFHENVRSTLAGADIMRATNLSSGTMYPLLLRFEDGGLLESRWEKQKPEDLGRPRRRLYSLTAEGAKVARHALEGLGVGSRLLTPRGS
jgi:DNA-binding MarR family transcriptional regulator